MLDAASDLDICNICNEKTDMKHGTWNVRSLYRADSLKTEGSELARLARYQGYRVGGSGLDVSVSG
jgi:hypothetical protein